MRYFCVVMLLASTIGSADVFVADRQQSAGGLKGTKPREQPLADIPKEFAFLFHSPAPEASPHFLCESKYGDHGMDVKILVGTESRRGCDD